MMAEEEIIAKLTTLGYDASETRMALRDVGQIIVEKAAAAYLVRLPEAQQSELRSFSTEELQNYLAEQGTSMPKMTQEEFEKIHDETWEDYFSSMSQ